MRIKNSLKQILEGLGIKSIIPTDSVLSDQLAGMTLIRFNKLLNNSGASDIQVHEILALTRWLSELTGKPKSSFKLVPDKREEVTPC